MDYIQSYKSFINSHYLSEGIRITTGVLLPAFLMSYFNMLSTGIVISVGALFVSVTDSAGPVHHRRNGMFVCIISILIVTLLVGFVSGFPALLVLFLFIFCFFFSMIGIYGTRAASIGTATMLVITLSIDPHLNLTSPFKIIQHSLYMTSGGLWYMCFSMLLYNFRPYRLAQQALGDYIQETAKYLLIRANFYKKNVNFQDVFSRAMQQQAIVQQKQTDITELLFKTRSIVKESTTTGRALVMINLDVADIFERIIMSHQQYPLLHTYFDTIDILNNYFVLARDLGTELDLVGIAVKSGEPSYSNGNLTTDITKTKAKIEELRHTFLKPDNIEGFISLRRILENIEDLANRLANLHKYTNHDGLLLQKPVKDFEYKKMISSQQISLSLFIDNLTLKSETFRHALRVSIAITAGFFVALFLQVGHSYWILLTIVVILKPAYGLTKKRNGNRLAGTVGGILIGIIILFFIKNNTVLLALLILFMAGSYSFLRTNYFISVLLMTPYLILFYHLLSPYDFNLVLKDRLIDTVIGSVIAFFSSLFLFPLWEKGKIKPVMITMLEEVIVYFSVIANSFTNKVVNENEQRLARKNALVALANLSDAFNRMLSEPKYRQKNIEALHQFVVLNNMLTSYVATLSDFNETKILSYNSNDFIKVAEDIKQNIADAISNFNNKEIKNETIVYKESLRALNERVNVLLQKRKDELQQGLLNTATRQPLFDLKSVVDQFSLIYNASVDINKISGTLKID